MAKIAFSKLGLKKNTEVKIIKWNDQEIEVKQYLPIEEKLDLVAKILNQSIDDNGYYNVARVQIFKILEIVFAYTNISFTDKQKEDVYKLYDLITGSGLWHELYHYEDCGKDIGAIPEDEYDEIHWWVEEMIGNIYKYKNSALGIMENISKDYSNLNLEATDLHDKIADPNNLTLLKDVITKLG